MDWPAFLFACAALILTPGAGTLSVLAARTRGGRRAGLLAIAGLVCGDLILVIAVSAGLAGVLQQWPAAQHLLRWAGALYLLGLAATLWQAAPTTVATIKANRHAFGHSLLLTLLNPKAILFFAVFFPPFAPPGSGISGLILPGLLFCLLNSLWLTLLLPGAPATLLGPRWRPWLAAGFVLLAARLITS